jgi:hypothetical protein
MFATELPGEFDRLSDEQLHDGFVEGRREIAVLQARSVRHLAEIIARRSYEPAGYLSAVAFVCDRTGMGRHAAAELVRLATALDAMPETAAAFADGDLDLTRVRHLVRTRQANPEAFRRMETTIVAQAGKLSLHDLRIFLDLWRQNAAPEVVHEEVESQRERRRLSISPTFEGMVRLDADLDRESGAIVAAAIGALAEPGNLAPDDDRTPPQRRADALVDMCRDHLDHGDAPVSGGEKPHITVVVDLETLEGRAGRKCEIDEAGVITPEAIRRLACDASIVRAVMAGESEVLDMGRRTRVVTPAQRRALELRDGGCVIDGCTAPARWTDAHHIVHWADGGVTALINLVLLCRRHHTMVHEGKIEIRPP